MKKIIRRENGSIRVQTINEQKTRTQQHHKEQCDVNNIIKKYQQTGIITHMARDAGIYSGLAPAESYFDAMKIVLDAKDAFMTLPADVRKKFRNDPQELLSWMQDPKNLEEGVKLGLFEKTSLEKAAAPEPKAANQPQQNSETATNNSAPS